MLTIQPSNQGYIALQESAILSAMPLAKYLTHMELRQYRAARLSMQTAGYIFFKRIGCIG